jgi:tetratricopeptide (TPR) repeat protein
VINHRKKIVIPIALLLIGTGLYFLLGWRSSASSAYPFPINSTKADTLSEDIALYEKRVLRDPEGALDWDNLAELYLALGKRSGSPEAFAKAESAAKKSLANRAAANSGAVLVLADVAQARHNFKLAVALADKILLERPGASEVYPILVSAYLAMGNLAEADRVSAQLLAANNSANANVLRALVLEAKGSDDEAFLHYTQALKEDEFGETSSAAWNREIFARFELNHGRKRNAKALVEEALRIQPKDPSGLALLARLEENLSRCL